MIDQAGREIDYLRVSVTDRCNLRCVYCMPAEGIPLLSHSDLLSFEEIERICACAAKLGIKKFKLTGGEPLVRLGLPELARRLRKLPGAEQVTLTTNGVLLGKYAGELVGAIDSVNVSLDTLDPAQFTQITRRDQLPQVLEGISAALNAGLRVRVNCVPSRTSDKAQILAIAGLARTRPVDVRFIEMMPVGQGDAFDGVPTDELKQWLTEAYGPLTPTSDTGNGPAAYEKIPGFAGRLGFISAVTKKFCAHCNRVRLTSAGFLKLCLDYDLGIDLRGALRAGMDDEKLLELMRDAIAQKPDGHQFGQKKTSLVRSMAQIGG